MLFPKVSVNTRIAEGDVFDDTRLRLKLDQEV